MISPTELAQRYDRLNQPIMMLLHQIQDSRAFAVAGVQHYGDMMLENFDFALVFNTGLFLDNCHMWQVKPVREFRLTNKTAQKSGFHSANMMIEQ
jgi:hypothetical protein